MTFCIYNEILLSAALEGFFCLVGGGVGMSKILEGVPFFYKKNYRLSNGHDIPPPHQKKMVGNNAHVPYVPAALDGTSMSSERGVRIGTIYVAPWHKELKF